MKAMKFELKLDVEQKLLKLEHKQDKKILEQKKEFALLEMTTSWKRGSIS
jgi:hypothetical protein